MYLAVHPILALRIGELAIPLAVAMKVWAELLAAAVVAVGELCAPLGGGLFGFAARGGGGGVVDEGGGGDVLGKGLEC